MPTPTIPLAKREYLSQDEAAAILGVHRETVRRAIAAGRLRAHKPHHGRVYITRADLHAFATGEAAS